MPHLYALIETPRALEKLASIVRADRIAGVLVGTADQEHEQNRGFLRALHALARAAGSIGEQEECERCTQFLKDSSPTAAQTLG